ncbi:MAG TPA: outer membrane beta-barrel protein [Pyrinomonadaceae bacterium]|jgi:opacity protein-like surface antigen
MRKLILLTAMILACASVSFAQDDYNKVEFAVGYSHARVDTGVDDPDFEDDFGDFLTDRRGFNGFDTSITGNVSRYVGLKGNFTGHFKSDSFTDGLDTINTKERIYNFLGGVQIKDNSKTTRFKPFAHFLAGGAHQSIEFSSPGFSETFKLDDTSFALKAGAGLDIRVHDRVDLRVIEFNYNPIFIGDRDFEGITIQGQTQHNFTIGFGITIH